MKFSFVPQRLQSESYEDYKERRKFLTKAFKEHRKGKVFHNSASDGVYRKEPRPEHIHYVKCGGGGNNEYRKIVTK